MADSVSEDVGDKAATAVTALALAGVTVVKRKVPGVPEGGGALPQVVISVDGEGPVRKNDALTDMVSYPVAVTIVTAGGQKAGDDPVPRKWREQIRKKLQTRATFSGISGFNRVTTEGKAPFDPAALPKDFNFSTQVFTVEVRESRT